MPEEAQARRAGVRVALMVPVGHRHLAGEIQDRLRIELRFDEGIGNDARPPAAGLEPARGPAVADHDVVDGTEHVVEALGAFEHAIDQKGRLAQLVGRRQHVEVFGAGRVMDGAFPVHHHGVDGVQASHEVVVRQDAPQALLGIDVAEPAHLADEISLGHVMSGAAQHSRMRIRDALASHVAHEAGVVEKHDLHGLGLILRAESRDRADPPGRLRRPVPAARRTLPQSRVRSHRIAAAIARE